MTNSELLLKACREQPDCETALSALHDALLEEGDERASLTAVLLEVYSQLKLLPDESTLIQHRDYHRFKLRIIGIEVADFLCCDREGRVFPVKQRTPAAVGMVVEPQTEGQLKFKGFYLSGATTNYLIVAEVVEK